MALRCPQCVFYAAERSIPRAFSSYWSKYIFFWATKICLSAHEAQGAKMIRQAIVTIFYFFFEKASTVRLHLSLKRIFEVLDAHLLKPCLSSIEKLHKHNRSSVFCKTDDTQQHGSRTVDHFSVENSIFSKIYDLWLHVQHFHRKGQRCDLGLGFTERTCGALGVRGWNPFLTVGSRGMESGREREGEGEKSWGNFYQTC